MLLDNNVMGLIPDSKRVDTRYLLRFLQSQDFYLLTGRTAVPAIRSSILRAVKVPLPPLAEQQRIAAILDKADAVRRKRQQTLDLADQFLRSAFLGMFGAPVTNPKGWPERRLDSFAEIRGGVTKGRKLGGHHVATVPYVRVANVQDGFLDLREVKQIQVLDTDVDKYRLLRGDVLLTEGGDPDKLGRGAVWTGEIDPCIHQNHIFSVRVDAHVAEPQYISTLLGSAYGKRYFLRAGKQTTGIATINRTQLGKFSALLPPVEVQRRYADLAKRVEKARARYADAGESSDALLGASAHRAFQAPYFRVSHRDSGTAPL
jgi:type I restriction enzyme S subunit